MVYLRDELTGALLKCPIDGSKLIKSYVPRYALCPKCEEQGRDVYVSISKAVF